jgi:hypothetical protein
MENFKKKNVFLILVIVLLSNFSTTLGLVDFKYQTPNLIQLKENIAKNRNLKSSLKSVEDLLSKFQQEEEEGLEYFEKMKSKCDIEQEQRLREYLGSKERFQKLNLEFSSCKDQLEVNSGLSELIKTEIANLEENSKRTAEIRNRQRQIFKEIEDNFHETLKHLEDLNAFDAMERENFTQISTKMLINAGKIGYMSSLNPILAQVHLKNKHSYRKKYQSFLELKSQFKLESEKLENIISQMKDEIQKIFDQNSKKEKEAEEVFQKLKQDSDQRIQLLNKNLNELSEKLTSNKECIENFNKNKEEIEQLYHSSTKLYETSKNVCQAFLREYYTNKKIRQEHIEELNNLKKIIDRRNEK